MKFRLQAERSAHRVLRKLFSHHVQRVGRLLKGELHPQAVHEARKSVKRLRALVEMMRHTVPEAAKLQPALRRLHHQLAPLRDAQTLCEAFDRLTGSTAQPDEWAAVRAQLYRGALEHQQTSDERWRAHVQRQLERLEQRWHKLNWRRRGWKLLAPNLRAIYRRGRRECLRLQPDAPPEDWHELRKWVKRIQYFWELLIPLWPERLEHEHRQWDELGELLGWHHDAQALHDWLSRQAVFPSAVTRSMQQALLQQQRAWQPEAFRRARRLFAETPSAVVRRFRQYWKIWQQTSRSTSANNQAPTHLTLLDPAVSTVCVPRPRPSAQPFVGGNPRVSSTHEGSP
ncbi:MAG: CHAD domain-containing protein [Planctomycetaceae bacterium]|nr:MAG: CHAD domain-containing protein [Planctomycetaceae bacterium]